MGLEAIPCSKRWGMALSQHPFPAPDRWSCGAGACTRRKSRAKMELGSNSGSSQNPGGRECWGSECMSNPGQQKWPGACRAHWACCSWTPRPGPSTDAPGPAQPAAGLGGAEKSVANTGFPISVPCPSAPGTFMLQGSPINIRYPQHHHYHHHHHHHPHPHDRPTGSV